MPHREGGGGQNRKDESEIAEWKQTFYTLQRKRGPHEKKKDCRT